MTKNPNQPGVLHKLFEDGLRSLIIPALDDYFRKLGTITKRNMKTYEVEALFCYEVDAESEEEAIEIAEEIHASNCTNLGDAPSVVVSEIEE